MAENKLHQRIKEAGLRITLQRIVVLEVLDQLNHPTADQILQRIKSVHPNISTATIYKILDAFEEKGLVKKIETKGDVMRYDSIVKKHHHLFSSDSSIIQDYFDDELFELVENYLSKKNIPDFEVSDIKIQLIGKFKN